MAAQHGKASGGENTSRRRHLGAAAGTEADSTVWAARGPFTRQSGFQTAAARLAWLNSGLLQGQLVRLKLFFRSDGFAGRQPCERWFFLPWLLYFRESKEKAASLGGLSNPRSNKARFDFQTSPCKNEPRLFPAEERQREKGEKIRLTQRNFSN